MCACVLLYVCVMCVCVCVCVKSDCGSGPYDSRSTRRQAPGPPWPRLIFLHQPFGLNIVTQNCDNSTMYAQLFLFCGRDAEVTRDYLNHINVGIVPNGKMSNNVVPLKHICV